VSSISASCIGWISHCTIGTICTIEPKSRIATQCYESSSSIILASYPRSSARITKNTIISWIKIVCIIDAGSTYSCAGASCTFSRASHTSCCIKIKCSVTSCTVETSTSIFDTWWTLICWVITCSTCSISLSPIRGSTICAWTSSNYTTSCSLSAFTAGSIQICASSTW